MPYLKLKHLVSQIICFILFLKKTSHALLVQPDPCLHTIAQLICLNTRFFIFFYNKSVRQVHFQIIYFLGELYRQSPKSIFNIYNPTGLKLLGI